MLLIIYWNVISRGTFYREKKEFDVEFDTGVDKFEQKKAVTGLSQSE